MVHLQVKILATQLCYKKRTSKFRNPTSGHNNTSATIKPQTMATQAAIVLKPHLSDSVNKSWKLQTKQSLCLFVGYFAVLPDIV